MSQQLSVAPTVHMNDLLGDDKTSRSIAISYPEIQRVLIQTAIDTMSVGNVDTVAPTLLGIKHVQDILLLFKVKGDTIIEKENKQNAKTAR